jgi:hypothetical protein
MRAPNRQTRRRVYGSYGLTRGRGLDRRGRDGRMRIPNTDRAVIAPDKLVKYLLNVEHPKGGSKAKLLVRMGYQPDNWQQLEADIRSQHLSAELTAETENEYGTRYEIVAPLAGPAGRAVTFRSVWQIDAGTDIPRLITMVPE